MANKGPAFGLSRECQMKTLAKFDIDRAKEAFHWMEEVLGKSLNPSSQELKDQKDVRNALKDGTALCELMNALNPGSIKKINNSSIAFKEMENIEFFLKACKNWGMKEVDTFQTQDLYDTKAIYSVINCLYILGSLAAKKGYQGPIIGVKLAEENKRDFSEEMLVKGKAQLSLVEEGQSKGSSQRGMTPYGMPRKM